jgi:hypothetical protein
MKLTYSWLEAIVSHEKLRAKDEISSDLNDGDSLLDVYRTLDGFFKDGKKPVLRILCHFDRVEPPPLSSQGGTQRSIGGRRTTTQRQLDALLSIVEAEEASSNFVIAISDRWACTSLTCGNRGFVY